MSKIIKTILTPALKLWLNSQVEKLEALNLFIEGNDYQILNGYLPEVTLSSYRLIYKGLSLEEIKLKVNDVRINIGQILRGQSLKLLEDIRISGKVAISNESLKASIPSNILQDGVKYLLNTLLKNQEFTEFFQKINIMDSQLEEIYIDYSHITIQIAFLYKDAVQSITIKMKPNIVSPQILSLKEVEIKSLSEEIVCLNEEILIDLGQDININQISLDNGKLFCQCELKIYS